MKRLLMILCATVLVLGITITAHAVIISLHADNEGIDSGSFAYTVGGYYIYIWETWTSSGPGFLQISGLEDSQNYTVTKIITNNSGDDWTRFANELLDPASGDDDVYDQPIAAWVPAGFSHSNDYDGLSFAQGSGILRDSQRFADLVVDELDTIDFIDFYNGVVSGAGGRDIVTFGLRDIFQDDWDNQPFLLAERPNSSSSPPVPEPTTILLLGTGLVGLVGCRKKFKK